MDIDKLVNLITQQVKERLEAMEGKKKVLILGGCEGDRGDTLRSSLEANGFCLYELEECIEGQNLYDYDYVVIPRSRLDEIVKKPDIDAVCSMEEAKAEVVPEKAIKLEKKVVTEKDIQKLAREGCTEIRLERKAIITPLAHDMAKVSGIRLVKQ